MGSSAHQGFDLAEGSGEVVVDSTQHTFDPPRSLADEVGPKHGQLLLELHPNGVDLGFSSPLPEHVSRLSSAILAACRREHVLLRKTPLKHDFEPEFRSRAPLSPEKAANSGTAFFTPTDC